MSNLDDLTAQHTLDKDGMRHHIAGFADQARRGWDAAGRFTVPDDYRSVDKVLFAGMGGSAIAGDILADLAGLERGPLVHVHRGYGLPEWADDRTLVVVSSYSGNTEETLSSYDHATERGLKVLALTSGGTLGEKAAVNGHPVYHIDMHSQPRATLGFTLPSLVRIFANLGFISDKATAFEETQRALQQMGTDMGETQPADANPAKQLAQRLHGRIPVIYGAGHLTNIAFRWKTQINENPSAWAFAETLPEVDHNSVVAYEAPPDIRERITIVFLRSSLLHPRVLARYEVTAGLLDEFDIPHVTIDAEGDSPLAQILSTVLHGDWASYYLAVLYGVDPTPVRPIDLLKRRLSER